MPVPKQERSVELLRPDFRERLEAWLVAATAAAAPLKIGIHETLRSAERQAYLYSLGRTRAGQKVTWVTRSKHQDGVAADFHLIKDGVAVWDAPTYQALYRAVPPEQFGLRTIPGDWVHLELADEPVPLPEPDRLLTLFDLENNPVAEVPLPAAGNARLIVTVSPDGKRLWARPEIT